MDVWTVRNAGGVMLDAAATRGVANAAAEQIEADHSGTEASVRCECTDDMNDEDRALVDAYVFADGNIPEEVSDLARAIANHQEVVCDAAFEAQCRERGWIVRGPSGRDQVQWDLVGHPAWVKRDMVRRGSN